MKLLDFEKHLKRYNCQKKREGGSHSIWENSKGKSTSVPRHKEIKNMTIKAICKQLDIPSPV